MKLTPVHILSIIIAALVVSAAVTLSVLYLRTDGGSFIMADPRQDTPHIATYRNLPVDFLHAGNLLIFRGRSDYSTSALAEHALPYTGYFKAARLEQALCAANGIQKGTIPAGKTIVIPHSLPTLMPDMKNRYKSPLIFTRGLYYTGSSAGNEKIIASIPSLIKAGVNTIVFDAKDVTGIVNYNSHIPDVVEFGTNQKHAITDIDKLIRVLKKNNIYVIARVAIFRDILLAKKMPSYAIHSKRTGAIWNERESEIWCDPTNRDVQDYNLQIAVELANKGVDEIQFDYIRFPTAGDLSDARFAWSYGVMNKDKCIEQFLSRAHHEMASRNVNFSIDVFGVVAWGYEGDIEKTGQRIELLSKYCDVISPMLYPSHFNDHFDGYAKPGDAPYYFIYTGCQKFRARAGTTPIRPWLQAFGWRVSNYNAQYILEQMRASDDARSAGYLFWNAANSYDTVIEALREQSSARKPVPITRTDEKIGNRKPL
jgi:hypothetical protein